MAVTPNFSIPLYTGTDTAKLSTLLNGQATALDTNLKTYLTSGKSIQYSGTTASRTSLTGMSEGDTYQETDSLKLLWVYQGAKWLIAPGQVLGSMIGPNTASGILGTGTLIGSIVSTPILPIGQKLKIFSRFSGYSLAGKVSVIDTAWRNNATNVSFSTRDGATTSRINAADTGFVSSTSNAVTYTTTAAAKVSAGIFLADGTSGVFGADGTYLWIESA